MKDQTKEKHTKVEIKQKNMYKPKKKIHRIAVHKKFEYIRCKISSWYFFMILAAKKHKSQKGEDLFNFIK